MTPEIFKEKLQIIANDRILLEALRWAFNERIEKEKPEIGETDDNILLGQKFRAYETNKRIMNRVLADIASYAVERTPKKEFNKER